MEGSVTLVLMGFKITHEISTAMDCLVIVKTNLDFFVNLLIVFQTRDISHATTPV